MAAQQIHVTSCTKKLTGDFDITTKIVDIPKYENGQISGLMIRESLESGAKMAMLADGWLKAGENVRAVYRTAENQDVETSFFKKSDGSVLDNSNYDTSKEECRVPKYMRMQRTGNTIHYLFRTMEKTGLIIRDSHRL